jgi:predicted nucleotidyltransferase
LRKRYDVPVPELDVQRILRALEAESVRFVVIGGVALAVQGYIRSTVDLDIVYARDQPNMTALTAALAPLHPRLRTSGGDVPFLWDARTLRSGTNFTLVTDAGALDLLADLPGVESFDSLWERADVTDLYGVAVRVASLDDLLAMKRATGRLKDESDVLALEDLKRFLEQQ